MQQEKIINIRSRINTIDSDILTLLKNRKGLTNELIQYKVDSFIPVNDFNRESQILNRLISESENIISKETIELVFKRIFEESKSKHYNLDKNNKHQLFELINTKPLIIAGPCTVESYQQIDSIANELSSLGIKFLRGGGYKPRTNPDNFQGLGAEGIRMLSEIAAKYGMYTVTEVTSVHQLEFLYNYIDVVQIGSRMMTSYAFLSEIGEITSNDCKPILLKRGMSSTINEMIYASEYLSRNGNNNIIFCLRGIRTFEQVDSAFRYTPDIAGIIELKEKRKNPVIFDPSHSAGDGKYVSSLSYSALAAGADGLLIEVDTNPDIATVDTKQLIKPEILKLIMKNL